MIEASVIVALNPHEGGLDAIVDGYRRQTGVADRFELIIVDNGSRGPLARYGDETAGGLQLRCVHSALPGRAASNNAGVRTASAGTLIFVADDFIPGPTLVSAHLEFHRHLVGAGVGIGPAFFTPDCRGDPFRRWLEDSGRLFGVPFRTAALNWPRDFFYVGNTSLSRDLYERVGGFDERCEHDLFDDVEFGLRLRELGIPTHLLAKAIAWHDHPVTLAERTVAMQRAGVAARRLDATRTDHRPWQALSKLPVDALARRAFREPAGADLARRYDYYSATMDLAFVRGYRGVDEAATTP